MVRHDDRLILPLGVPGLGTALNRYLVKLPGFPDEAPLSTPRNRLWLTSEVRAYVHRKPARIPHTTLRAA